jgi:uncharacterized membrane protein YfcA
MLDFSYWYMLPVGVAISTVAMMAGIGGAILYAPFFMLVLKMEPLMALAAGLVIEVLGFGSGVLGYLWKRSINFHVVGQVLWLGIGGTVLGVIAGRLISASLLKIVLALVLHYLSYEFLFNNKVCSPKDPRCTSTTKKHSKKWLRKELKATTFSGGFLLGMVSGGLGEINEFNFLKKLKLSVPAASGTSVFIVAVCALIGIFAHGYLFSATGDMPAVAGLFSLAVFTIPGVVVGAQLGVQLANRIKTSTMSTFLGGLFLLVAGVTFMSAFLDYV